VTENKNAKNKAGALRGQAEKISRQEAPDIPENLERLAPAAVRKLLHELRVHQIELEMQNEELNKRQAELEASRAQYFELYDVAPVGYFSISEKGLILEANLTGANLLKTVPHDVRSQRFTHFIFKEDQDVYYLHRKQLFETRAPQVCEMRMMRRDGALFWARLEAALAQDGKSGKPVCLATISDITLRKQAEAALKESEERYQRITEGLTDYLYTVRLQDGQAVETMHGQACAAVTGYSKEEFADNPHLWISMVVADERDLVSERVQRILAGENIPHIEHRIVRKDGQIRWVRDTPILQFDPQGKLVSYDGVIEDITSHKQAEEALRDSEEKYRMVVENALEAIFIAADGTLKFANSRTTEVTGYTQEELTSRPFTEFIHPEDRDTVIDRHLRRMKGEDIPKKIYSFRIVDKPGNIKWVELSVVLIAWEGRPATLNFLTDITDRKRLEEERQRVDKLESVGVLAGGIAHDFNNILTAILGNISLAGMDAAPGSDLQNSLEQAEKASLRAKALTKQLLTFSKGGAPVTELASLTELLKETARFALRGSKVKCHFSIPAGLWHAEIDAGQVSQVIQNLVINAQQSMPIGGTIELTAENIALSETQSLGRGLPLKAGNYVRIAVADHGTGIPGYHMEKIFDPFFTTKQKGSGLGLATSFSIARQHGGHISVESELGAGSTFYFYLPASTEIVTPKHDKRDKKEAIKPAGKARILVMDDEQDVREIAGRMLWNIGYQDIEFAVDGAEAIKLYKAAMETGNPFTVAILDLTIAGGMGGEEAVKKLLKIDSGVKAIVSSGYADDPVIAKYGEYGFSGMVAKPYTIEELGKAVQDVIG
jgi:PAS domain S-box-containing protein